MNWSFTMKRNLLTCIKSTFSLTSPGFRLIKFSLKKVWKIDRQFTSVQKGLGGGWEDKSWQNIYYSSEQFALPISLPGDQKDSLLSYGATDRGTLWRVLAGSHWWRLVELLAWTNHGQAQPGQSSTWLASESLITALVTPQWRPPGAPCSRPGSSPEAFVIFILTLFVFA